MASRPTGMWTMVEIFQQLLSAKEWSNIFWFRQSAAVAPNDMRTAAQALVTEIAGELNILQSDQVTVEGARVLFNNGTGTYGVELYEPAVGLISVDPLPSDVAVVVQRLSTVAGPSGRGRIYLGGIPNTYADGSYLNTPGDTALSAFCFALSTPISSGGVDFGHSVFSPKTGAFNAITQWTQDALLATNRKRRPRF